MLTVEEKNFLDHYKNASYHRFYEIERFANLCQKTSFRLFDILEQIKT